MKKIFTITFILAMIILITGCGSEKSEGNYNFPVASFIPSGMEYQGSGKIEWSSKNEEITPKYADAYISNAKIEDVINYVKDLKSKGLHNANAYHEEQTDFDEYGSFSWVGVNDAENFSISITMSTETTPLSLVDASYNLSIVMSDANPYGE